MFRRVRHRNVGAPFLVYGENAGIGWVFGRLGAAWPKNMPDSGSNRRGREARTSFRVLAARCARGLPGSSRPLISEGAGKTGCALHPRSHVQIRTKQTHMSIQVQRKHSCLPCAMALRLISRSPRSSGLSSLRRLAETGTSARSGLQHLHQT